MNCDIKCLNYRVTILFPTKLIIRIMVPRKSFPRKINTSKNDSPKISLSNIFNHFLETSNNVKFKICLKKKNTEKKKEKNYLYCSFKTNFNK